jgi:hypothetical protein
MSSDFACNPLLRAILQHRRMARPALGQQRVIEQLRRHCACLAPSSAVGAPNGAASLARAQRQLAHELRATIDTQADVVVDEHRDD